MKAPKFFLAGLLALSTVGVAQAQTVVHITGSTAFRAAVHSAITNILEPGFVYAYTGTFPGTTTPVPEPARLALTGTGLAAARRDV